MIKLTINNQSVEVADGATILDAANKLGIHIPTMCFLKGMDPSISCMVCVVEVKGKRNLVPACASIAADGMEVVTDSEEVLLARKTAVELLLSDHIGDCVGPCVLGCPAKMNIPLMIRQIAAGKLDQAIRTVKADIPLPAVLGRVCPAPCERACRRNDVDESISICLLKRFVGDYDLMAYAPYVPECQADTGKKVAVIGAGPAGLSVAYYLTQKGHKCTIYDDHDKPGGMLRYGVAENDCPGKVIDGEVDLILRTGIDLKLNCRIGKDIPFDYLCKDNDAVFIAAGADVQGNSFGSVQMAGEFIKADKKTYTTSVANVFAGGDATGKRQLAVRAVADGKEAAESIHQFLMGAEIVGSTKRFNSRMGKCSAQELEIFTSSVSDQPRILPDDHGEGGYPAMQAVAEANRCLHCDCRKPEDCKLRNLAEETGAKQARFKTQRGTLVQHAEHTDVVYEPGKCIDCGLCTQITAEQKESLGLTFIGRGFDIRIGVPFNKNMTHGVQVTADKCVKACPTGALAYKKQ